MSKMPPKGVSIGVTATVKFSNTVVPQANASVSSAATTDAAVTSLPSQNEVTVTVIVTSVSKPTNKKEITFTVFNKN
ncbi:hypothetical protein MKQ70_25440 [Chitinophaga sedimenti]|uniref:hypothetical protein n=1 Tax=Chitinophaga sedimenti TaxID=2033606 RepID=UPI00200355C5|nr:hypothetical protein [Chitinophaga sedimenti]MCK7558168.1 hypothetical protein [Chitinophaga sedimenti]